MSNFDRLINANIAVIGLGYVGLPLAVEFGKAYQTIGFDISAQRIRELKSGRDRTLEVESEDLSSSTHLTFSSDTRDIADCSVYVVTVPTPISQSKQPDLSPLMRASELIGTVLSAGDIVVYESTVFPGATEERCVPVLEKCSGLTYNTDFFCGYSPERINPGDKEHRLTSILKVTAGSTPDAAEFVDALYRSIIPAGTHRAPSIRVAEAAKVIENTQRDVNIALINELALIFDRLGIDTGDVLAAARTKWNFLPFSPGLVGGHCISVDPYYLTHKAQEIGYHPAVILAGRRINDSMGREIAEQLVKAMASRGIGAVGAKILTMGLTFKENCPDLRNTRVVDIIDALKDYGATVDVHDPWVDPDEARHEYGIELRAQPEPQHYDAIVLAVGHDRFKLLGADGVRAFGKREHILYDVKSLLARDDVDARL